MHRLGNRPIPVTKQHLNHFLLKQPLGHLLNLLLIPTHYATSALPNAFTASLTSIQLFNEFRI
jgi:hypothetical protein